MPKYTFTCPECGTEIQKYVPSTIEEIACESCKAMAKRQLPALKGAVEVRELVDPYTNVSWDQNQKDLVKERREDYYWTVEVPRLVEKYSLETCLENKWLIYNEKGDLVINKPPSKR